MIYICFFNIYLFGRKKFLRKEEGEMKFLRESYIDFTLNDTKLFLLYLPLFECALISICSFQDRDRIFWVRKMQKYVALYHHEEVSICYTCSMS